MCLERKKLKNDEGKHQFSGSSELELLFPITHEFVYTQGYKQNFVVSAPFLVLGGKDDRHSRNTSDHYSR